MEQSGEWKERGEFIFIKIDSKPEANTFVMSTKRVAADTTLRLKSLYTYFIWFTQNYNLFEAALTEILALSM